MSQRWGLFPTVAEGASVIWRISVMAVPAGFSLLKGSYKGGSGSVERNREESKDGNSEKYSFIHLLIQALFYGGPTMCQALGQLFWSFCRVQNT